MVSQRVTRSCVPAIPAAWQRRRDYFRTGGSRQLPALQGALLPIQILVPSDDSSPFRPEQSRDFRSMERSAQRPGMLQLIPLEDSLVAL